MAGSSQRPSPRAAIASSDPARSSAPLPCLTQQGAFDGGRAIGRGRTSSQLTRPTTKAAASSPKRSTARASRADCGPPCWRCSRHGPRVISVGTSRSPWGGRRPPGDPRGSGVSQERVGHAQTWPGAAGSRSTQEADEVRREAPRQRSRERPAASSTPSYNSATVIGPESVGTSKFSPSR